MTPAPPSIRLISSIRPLQSSRADGRLRPSAFDLLLDLEVRIGVRRNLRQVRDAQHLKCRAEHPQLPADDIRDAPADAGVDLVEDQSGRRRARTAIDAALKPCASRASAS